MLDVAIIGGGPAGLYAGSMLAAGGFSVTVFEEHPEVGRPVHCTGVLAADAFAEFGLAKGAILNELRRARFIAPSGAEICHTTASTEAIVVDRAALDRSLAQQAVEAGVTVRTGTRVRRINAQADRMSLDLDGDSVEARTVIVGCGAAYGLQRQLGLGTPPVALNSAQVEVPAARGGDVEVHFGMEVAPGGFAWTVPVTRPSGPFVRIGLMCQGDPFARFSRFAARIAPSWGVDVAAMDEPRRRYLPLSPLSRTFGRRLLVVGDAAGVVKPTTGGGIYYSLVSAKLAAETLAPALAADRLDEETLSAYQRLWRQRLGPELRSQLALRMLAQRLSDAEIDAFFELARTNGVMPLVRRVGQFNQHRHLIAELFRHAPARQLLFRRLIPV